MSEKKPEMIPINQYVDKKAYGIIKARAALEGKKVQDVVNEAIIFFAEKKGVK